MCTMSLFSVDGAKCKGDGACVAECPVRIIETDQATHWPKPVDGAEKVCINCGHCVAVCPHEALSLATMPATECRPFRPELNLSTDQAEQFMKSRRSVRVYKEKAVDRPVLEKIIDIARYAPSGVNRQNVYWMIVHNTQKVKSLAECTIQWMRGLLQQQSPMAISFRMQHLVDAWDRGEDLICRGAPHAVIAYGLKEDGMALNSCTIALTHFELAVLGFGLGACWAGYVNMALNMSPEAQDIVDIPNRTSSFGAMLVGYPRYKYARIPLRNNPRIIWR
jgi:nitroreductase/NAD-dependent dihydropyrimidine dehydrogenase PreA subunit